jgi:signal transduction histidine kinase
MKVEWYDMKRQLSTIKKIIACYSHWDDLFLPDEKGNIFSANTGSLLHDKNGELIAANPKAAEILDVKLKDLYQPESIRDLWKAQNNPLPFEDTCFIKTLKTGKSHSEILIIQLETGEERRIYFNSHPLFYANDSLAFSVVTNIADVKEDKFPNEKKERVTQEISEIITEVREQERTRIGHELHDNVNQILSTIKLFLEVLTPANDNEKMMLIKSREYIFTAMEEIRKLTQEWVVPRLKEENLTENIQRLVDDINISNVIKIKFEHDNENDILSPGKKITLFRIIQEPVKNILQHSKAKHVDVCVKFRDAYVRLTIKDDGIGFDATQTRRGIGLSNIYERSRFYNGTVDLHTSPGKGCTLIVNMPL